MKKISILALHLGYGGIEKCIVNLANVLCEKYKVEIACTYKLYEKSAFELDKRVKVKYLNGNLVPNKKELIYSFKHFKLISTGKEFFKALNVLYKRRSSMVNYIENCDSDIIISTRDIFNCLLGTFGKSGVVKIGWEHNHHHGNDKYATNIVNSAKKLDYLILVSEDLRKYYSKRLSNTNCKCIHIPNSIDKVPSKVSKLTNKRIISVGRLSPEKGFLDLLKVYEGVRMDYPDWSLDIIGDGSERDNLENYIKEQRLDNVTLHGFRDREYIDDLLNKSSIYVMTSFTESFGIVLIEAMSHGVPVVAYDSAEGAREIINSGQNGYLIKNRNEEMMKRKIEDFIKYENIRKKVGKEARKSIHKYTSEVVSKAWFDLIEESDFNE